MEGLVLDGLGIQIAVAFQRRAGISQAASSASVTTKAGGKRLSVCSTQP